MNIHSNLTKLIDKNSGINIFRILPQANITTSLHHFKNDKEMVFSQKNLYWLLNWINNLVPYKNIDDNLEICHFKCENLEKYWEKLFLKSSPSRKLSDLFWRALPWNRIKEELGEINIFDTGCGSGNMGYRLFDFSEKKINKYRGVDIYTNKNWERLEQKYSFIKCQKYNGNDITNYIPEGTNFFISQSAIEHFNEDLSFFKQIRNYILNTKRNTFQIHLFPSKIHFYLSPFHGLRQYTPRTISKITRLFKNSSYAMLFNLGGQNCNYLHYKFISNPIKKEKGDIRDIYPQKYDKLLFRLIQKDMEAPSKYPSFYALIIHSNWQNKIISNY